VSVLVADTLASFTTAPCWSTAVPAIVPVTMPWPNMPTESTNSAINRKAVVLNGNCVIGLSLLCVFVFTRLNNSNPGGV